MIAMLKEKLLGNKYEEDYIEYENEWEDSHDEVDQNPIPLKVKRKEEFVDDTVRVPNFKGMTPEMVRQAIITMPKSINDASGICDYIQSNKIVAVNMENLDIEDAQRIIDFLAGVVYALKGTFKPVTDKIYLVGPENSEITSDEKEQLKSSGLFSGFKSNDRVLRR